MLRAKEKRLDEIVAAIRRAHRPLGGEARIGLQVGGLAEVERAFRSLNNSARWTMAFAARWSSTDTARPTNRK